MNAPKRIHWYMQIYQCINNKSAFISNAFPPLHATKVRTVIHLSLMPVLMFNESLHPNQFLTFLIPLRSALFYLNESAMVTVANCNGSPLRITGSGTNITSCVWTFDGNHCFLCAERAPVTCDTLQLDTDKAHENTLAEELHESLSNVAKPTVQCQHIYGLFYMSWKKNKCLP